MGLRDGVGMAVERGIEGEKELDMVAETVLLTP